jgi:hypothetical protein
MNDEQMQSLIESWFEDTDPRPPDTRQATAHVMAHVPRTRQRGRRWSLPAFGHRAHPSTATNTIEYQPASIPATDGHTPIVIGRTQTMFSPSKALIAGALVFGIGGVMLIAQPFEQQGSMPGAEAEPIAATWVTGTVQPAPSCTNPDPVVDGDVSRSRDIECSPQTWTSSDPRLTGEVARRWNFDTHQTDEGSISVWMDAAYLRNDDGGWACSNHSLAKDEVDVADPLTFTCIGDGGYEGLSASLVLVDAGGNAEEFVGLIFSGDFPPLPEPPASE